MTYIEQYLQLKALFNLDNDVTPIPDSRVSIKNLVFQSTPVHACCQTGLIDDSYIQENNRFRYPVLMPDGKSRADKVIILLHGLNERTWHKHLTGAKYLAEKTGKAVLMFPLSFHINRGLPEWTDSRKAAGLLEARKKKYPEVLDATLANITLSERLTELPQRFFISGLQSTIDLIKLLKSIQTGEHPLFEKGTKADIFAYSISCMVMQSLMICNPGNVLDRSRVVFFAGGSLFSHMQGVSRFIMDSVAFESIRKFCFDIVKKKNGIYKELRSIMMEHNFHKAFLSNIAPGIEAKERKKAMDNFNDRLMVIALADDRIMPLEGIKQATGESFNRSNRFKTVHFPYAYTHENPFPVLYRKIDEQVERAFQSVFVPALNFLGE
jgi:hypothetical protein